MATGNRSAGPPLGPSSESDHQNGLEVDKCGRTKGALIATGTLMNNLPYMGEMTFDTRPRRGRKPKKADICHLISKNYGISFPVSYVNPPNCTLLEGYADPTTISNQGALGGPSELGLPDEGPPSEEPLNLCVRDNKRTSATSDSILVRPKPQPPESKGGPPPPPRCSRKRVKKPLDKVSSKPPSVPPPLPSEVSICKFKFTGGVRPTLQEKKMLSVDSGGNFRFYSDKQPNRVKGQSRLLGKVPVPQLPVTPFPPSVEEPPELTSTLPSPGEDSSSSDDSSSTATEFGSKRKRRTRKSLMRETLEKTFKEKGFLIQTQQLESAEGATYCKFRQLRKFTRYLFRSWKDYLPENVQGISVGAENRSSVPAIENELVENAEHI